jgi:hypothetical protein
MGAQERLDLGSQVPIVAARATQVRRAIRG